MRKLVIALTFFISLNLFVSCGRRGGGGPIGINPPETSLTISTIDSGSNAPIPGIRITLKRDGELVAAAQMTDESGLAIFDKVPAGDGYKAFANGQGYAPAASPSIKLLDARQVPIMMSRSIGQGMGLIAGSVKDSKTSLPLGGVDVSIQPASGVAEPGPDGEESAMAAQRVRRPQTRAAAYGSYRTMQYRSNTQYRRNTRAPQYRRFNTTPQLRKMNGSMVARTDSTGQFTLENLPVGTYQLVFKKAGYGQKIQGSIIVNDGDSTTVETVFMKKEGSVGSSSNTLIVDAGRAFELDPKGRVAWSFSGKTITSAVRMPEGNNLICDEMANQVSIVNRKGKVIWKLGGGLFSKTRLKQPAWVAAARDGQSFLIADTGNNRIIEVVHGQIAWQYRTKLSRPRAAVYAPNGNIIIADTGNKRVLEVTREHKVVWSFAKDMLAPTHATRMEDGSTLITDTGYSRVIRINQAGQPVWYYDQDLNQPRSTFVEDNGNVLIVDTGNSRMIEVDRSKTIVHEVNTFRRPTSVDRP